MSARSIFHLEWALLIVALTWPAPSAAAACDAVMVPASSLLRLDYDPFAFARTVSRLTFEVANHGPDACDTDLVLLDANRTAVAQTDIGDTGVVLAYSAEAGDAVLSPTAVPGTWRLRVEPGQPTKVSIEAVVRQDAVASAGEHSVALTLELRDAGEIATHVAALPVSVVLAVAPRAQMNIVGAAATFGEGTPIARIDFGVLESNESRRVFLQVRANGKARLTIESAHRGRLLLADGPEQETGIAYSARFIDEPVDLSHRWERIIEPPHSISGASLPLDLLLGDVGRHASGTYSDMLTLELSAL